MNHAKEHALNIKDFQSIRRYRDAHLSLPDLPPEEWSDFRKDYENGMSLKDIADKYVCDPRTVRNLLIINRNSFDIGRQRVPTRLDPYIELIEDFCSSSDRKTGICTLSRQITARIQELGYKGSERTVRNYLRSRFYILQKKGNKNADH